jgi:hypothetical protein
MAGMAGIAAFGKDKRHHRHSVSGAGSRPALRFPPDPNSQPDGISRGRGRGRDEDLPVQHFDDNCGAR